MENRSNIPFRYGPFTNMNTGNYQRASAMTDDEQSETGQFQPHVENFHGRPHTRGMDSRNGNERIPTNSGNFNGQLPTGRDDRTRSGEASRNVNDRTTNAGSGNDQTTNAGSGNGGGGNDRTANRGPGNGGGGNDQTTNGESGNDGGGNDQTTDGGFGNGGGENEQTTNGEAGNTGGGSNTNGNGDDLPPAGYIDLKVQDNNGQLTFFRIKRNAKLKKVFTRYATQVGVESASLRFLFDGVRLTGNETSDSLEMQNGDNIHVVLEQIGGDWDTYQAN